MCLISGSKFSLSLSARKEEDRGKGSKTQAAKEKRGGRKRTPPPPPTPPSCSPFSFDLPLGAALLRGSKTVPTPFSFFSRPSLFRCELACDNGDGGRRREEVWSRNFFRPHFLFSSFFWSIAPASSSAFFSSQRPSAVGVAFASALFWLRIVGVSPSSPLFLSPP